MVEPEVAKFLLPEPFRSTGDATGYITQIELLGNLQQWVEPIFDNNGAARREPNGNQLHSDKRNIIFPSGLRNGAVELYQSSREDTKRNYLKLRAAFQRQYFEPAEFLSGSMRKSVPVDSEQVSEFLSDWKLLARKASPGGSEEIRNHLVFKSLVDKFSSMKVRICLWKHKPASIAAALDSSIHFDAVYWPEPSALTLVSSAFSIFDSASMNHIDHSVFQKETLFDTYSAGEVLQTQLCSLRFSSYTSVPLLGETPRGHHSFSAFTRSIRHTITWRLLPPCPLFREVSPSALPIVSFLLELFSHSLS